MPAPFEAVYGASKAFLLSFSEALRNELKDTGVSVTALMPRPTETNFFHRAGMDDTKVGTSEKGGPAEVVGFACCRNRESRDAPKAREAGIRESVIEARAIAADQRRIGACVLRLIS